MNALTVMDIPSSRMTFHFLEDSFTAIPLIAVVVTVICVDVMVIISVAAAIIDAVIASAVIKVGESLLLVKACVILTAPCT